MDRTGTVLDILVQSRGDTQAAQRLLRKLLKRQRRAPRVLITDKLASYGAATREVMPSVEYRILLDVIGTGGSTKPSDGLGAKFPQYDYADMVLAQHRLLTEGLGVHHLRLVLGNSMGGMETWVWGATYPTFMDALVPMASQPTAMAGRNWMLRRMMIETIRRDPAYKDGAT